MDKDTAAVIAGVLLILGLIALSILRKHLSDGKHLRLRRILHEERLKAMEKDMPLPELPVDDRQLLSPVTGPVRDTASLPAIKWVRITSLCVGLFLAFGGVGMSLGFATSGEHELSRIWTLGFIPALAGMGLLLFYRLSRNFDDAGERD